MSIGMRKMTTIVILFIALAVTNVYAADDSGDYYLGKIILCFSAELLGNTTGEMEISDESGIVRTEFDWFNTIADEFQITSLTRKFWVKDHLWHGNGIYLMNIFDMTIKDDALVDELIKRLESHDSILYAERERIYRTSLIPNDPQHLQQYALTKIQAYDAWDINPGGSPEILIGICDSGVKWNHEDLQANMWVNEAELPGITINWTTGTITGGDGVDNDGNGRVDDVMGWDFYATGSGGSDNNPFQSNGGSTHGTHVAGCAAAVGMNGIGVIGPAYNVKIVATKHSPFGTATNSIYNSYPGILYLADLGVDIINCSWGSQTNPNNLASGTMYTINQVINYATDHGSLVVVAAGNGNAQNIGFDIDLTAYSPASATNAFTVAATNNNDVKTTFSNFGTNAINISAPGQNILSTAFSSSGADTYVNNSGTSMASPIVAGVAALIKSQNPSMSIAELRSYLCEGADNIDHLNTQYAGKLGAGRANAFNAIQLASPLDYDLSALSITGPTAVIMGEPHIYTIRVRNNGQYTANGFIIQLREVGNPVVLGSVTGNTLTSGNVAEYEVDFLANVAGTIQLYGECIWALDERPENNESSAHNVLVYPANITSQTLFTQDFESISDFEQDWTIVNGTQVNKWHIGTATHNGGSQSIYISSNNGEDYVYINNIASTVHFYRDITFPANSNEITLSFDQRGLGEGNNDYLRVSLCDVSYTPVAGSLPATNTQIGENYSGNFDWVNRTISINPIQASGLTKRLVFTWRNNTNTGTQPAAVDNISLTVYAPSTIVPPIFSLSPTAYSFGNILIGQTSQAETFTITNIGANALNIDTIVKTGIDAEDFTLSGVVNLPWNIAPNGVQTFSVSFVPTSQGAKSASINITHNASEIPFALALSGTSIPLSAPENLVASTNGFDAFLTWENSSQWTATSVQTTDKVSLGSTRATTSFRVYRGIEGEDFDTATLLTTIPNSQTNYDDIGVGNGDHIYYVTAVHDVGAESIPTSTLLSIWTFTHPPQNLTAMGENTQITLYWEAPIAGSTGNLLGYKVFRDTTQISGLLSPTTLSYTQGDLINGIVYTYSVKATYDDPVRDSEPSNSVDVSPLPLNPISEVLVFPEFTAIALSWYLPDEPLSIVGFKVYREIQGEFVSISPLLSIADNYYYDDGLQTNTTYNYKVMVIYHTPIEVEIPTDATASTLYPKPPVDPSATLDETNVVLTWSLPVDYDGNITGFKVYRRTGLDGDFASLTTGVIPESEYIDETTIPGNTYQYYVTTIYINPTGESAPPDEFITIAVTSSEDEMIEIYTTRLRGNYPNPFNPETRINFEIGNSRLEKTAVVIDIYNIKGQSVRRLVNGEYGSGVHSIVWNGKDDKGNDVTSGIYFYRMNTDGFIQTKRMLLLK